MKNAELQELLKQFPDDMPVKLRHETATQHGQPEVQPFREENVLKTSDTAYADDSAPENEWDSEDGKIRIDDGERYLLINPIIT